MRKNIYIKSMLRQPVRTLLLFLLIALASFAFVLRAVEYISVNRHIQAIAANYRSIGFLMTGNEMGDVSAGAEILARSDMVAFEDRRRQLEGILAHGIYTSDFLGMRRGIAMEDQWRFSVSYFYAYVNEVGDATPDGTIWLDLAVDDVLSGHPHHTVAGQRISLRFQFNPANPAATRQMSGLTEGSRYFFKAHYYQRFGPHGMVFPRAGNASDWLDIVPIDGESLWFIPASSGQALDFDALGLSHIPADAEMMHHNQRAVTLQTTIDMTAMPSFQGRGSAMRLDRGRLLNLDDHINANPVAVIHSAFAYYSNLQIGDILTIAVHENQFVDGSVTGAWAGGGLHDTTVQFTDAIVRSIPDEATVYMLELEIVGLYNNFISIGNNFGW